LHENNISNGLVLLRSKKIVQFAATDISDECFNNGGDAGDVSVLACCVFCRRSFKAGLSRWKHHLEICLAFRAFISGLKHGKALGLRLQYSIYRTLPAAGGRVSSWHGDSIVMKSRFL
jgi:hypothetical protein